MTAQQSAQNIDTNAILKSEHARRMRFRNALLEVLRAWEDLNDLPRSIPTVAERGERLPKTEHHNR